MKAHATRWIVAPALAALAMAGASDALYAQGGPGHGGPGRGGPGQRQEQGQGGFGGGMNADQMEQAATQMRGQQVRRMLNRSGVTDEAVAQQVENFVSAQAQATRSLRERARALHDALGDDTSTDAQIRTLLSALRTAAAGERDRRRQALRSLDAATGYSRNPRLEAALTLAGIIGDESSLLNGSLGGWPGGGPMGGPGMGGRGGMGGGQGPGGRPMDGGPDGMGGPQMGGPGGRSGRGGRMNGRGGGMGGRNGGPGGRGGPIGGPGGADGPPLDGPGRADGPPLAGPGGPDDGGAR